MMKDKNTEGKNHQSCVCVCVCVCACAYVHTCVCNQLMQFPLAQIKFNLEPELTIVEIYVIHPSL